MLNYHTFIISLKVFYSLMPYVDIFYDELQKRTKGPVELSNIIEENILKERQNVDNIFEEN